MNYNITQTLSSFTLKLHSSIQSYLNNKDNDSRSYSQAKEFRQMTDVYVENDGKTYCWVCKGESSNQNQHAYQLSKSYETALHQLAKRIEMTLDNREIALAAFLDIEGAFDRTSFEVMVGALALFGIEDTVGGYQTC